MRFEVRHAYQISKKAFWSRIFFDEKYNREAYLEALGFAHFEIVDQLQEDNGNIERKLTLEPNVEIPDLLRKVVGQKVRYTEQGHFDAKEEKWRYRVIPSQMPDKVEIQGTIWIEETPGGGITRVCDCDVSVRILGLGKMVEKLIVETTKTHYERVYVFTKRYIEANNLALPNA